jgi:O-antigen/teichoic acid export membrane protein
VSNLRISAFLKNLLILGSGAALGQVIVFIAAPILSRIYSPDNFGVLALYVALFSVISVMVSFRYEYSIPLEEDEEGAIALIKLSVIIATALSILVLMLIFLFNDVITNWAGTEKSSYLWLLPFGILFSGYYQILSYWYIRQENFKILAKTKIVQNLVGSGLQIVLGILLAGPVGLIVGFTLGVSTGVVSLAVRCSSTIRLASTIKLQTIKKIAIKHIDFARYNTPQTLINVLGQNIPQFLFVVLFNPAIGGYYLMAHRLLLYSSNFMANTYRQVFYNYAIKKYRDGGLLPLVIKATFMLCVLTILPAILINIYGVELFVLILGENWIKAGEYARYLVFLAAFGIINVPCSTLIPILNLHKELLVWEVLYLIAKLLVLMLAVYMSSDIMAVCALTTIGIIFNLILIIFVILKVWRAHVGLMSKK